VGVQENRKKTKKTEKKPKKNKFWFLVWLQAGSISDCGGAVTTAAATIP
jgi:hypothetical protein